MRVVFAITWLAALAASAWAAWQGWRGSRPLDVIRMRGAFGSERTASRWSVWSPTAILAISGMALQAPKLTPTFILFFLIWCGAIVYMSAYGALALKAARDEA